MESLRCPECESTDVEQAYSDPETGRPIYICNDCEWEGMFAESVDEETGEEEESYDDPVFDPDAMPAFDEDDDEFDAGGEGD